MTTIQKINKLVYTYAPNIRDEREIVNKLMEEFITSKGIEISYSCFENAKVCKKYIDDFKEYVKSRVGFGYDKNAEVLEDMKRYINKTFPEYRDDKEFLSLLMKDFRKSHQPKYQSSEKDTVNAAYCKKYMMHFLIYLKNHYNR